MLTPFQEISSSLSLLSSYSVLLLPNTGPAYIETNLPHYTSTTGRAAYHTQSPAHHLLPPNTSLFTIINYLTLPFKKQSKTPDRPDVVVWQTQGSALATACAVLCYAIRMDAGLDAESLPVRAYACQVWT